ncbi:flavodoxin-dependent (E)-4-hydroxy-3-methylbut-2-enyl-diphosphate synthase, partial [Pantoea agglomerans]|uniref:flavodoxin-dependent (E)-4-hydroxy-3-methylbut-2-enyl-diphosphate synthase n=1 Tax=Enterobacter agglomerans TaxID=549 RepID=UPI0030CA1942
SNLFLSDTPLGEALSREGAGWDREWLASVGLQLGSAESLEKDLQEKYGEPTPQALLESAMRHVDHLDRLNFDQFKVS